MGVLIQIYMVLRKFDKYETASENLDCLSQEYKVVSSPRRLLQKCARGADLRKKSSQTNPTEAFYELEHFTFYSSLPNQCGEGRRQVASTPAQFLPHQYVD